MFDGFSQLSHFNTNLGDNGRNLAALSNMLNGMAGREQGLDNFDDRGANIVFGASTACALADPASTPTQTNAAAEFTQPRRNPRNL